MTQAWLDGMVAKWQKRLRLLDWDVRADIKRAQDMMHEDVGGEILVQPTNHAAWLTMRDPVDIRPEYERFNDSETIVVHELLHILENPLGVPATGPKRVAAEWMIEVIARALVALDRKEGSHER